MKIVAKIDFTANGVGYIKGDELKDLTYEQVVKLNEKGFIEPLDFKDLAFLKRELDNKNKMKEEL